MNVQPHQSNLSPRPRLLVLLGALALAGACADDDGDADGFPDDDLTPRTCNELHDASLEATLGSPINETVTSDEIVQCGTLIGEDGTSGSTLSVNRDDGSYVDLQLRGAFVEGEAATLDVEVFLSHGTADDESNSWFGDCVFAISTFEFDDELVGSRTYRVGGVVNCADALEPFIAPDMGPLTLSDVDYNGTIMFD